MHVWTTRILSISLIVLSCWTPELAAAMAPQQPASGNQQAAQQPAAPTSIPPQTDSSGARLEDVLPDAPSQASTPAATTAAPAEPQQPATPEGTAAARAGRVIGGPASKPAGSAIAPAKQRQARSLLIKLGVLAGAGIALGTVYALSRSAPNRPPGTH